MQTYLNGRSLIFTYYTTGTMDCFLVLSNQLAAQNLPDGGLRQFIPELIVSGDLEGRQSFLAEGFEFFFRQSFAGFHHNPGLHSFTTVRVWDAGHAHVHHFWMCGNHFLHFTRPDLITTGFDEFLLAVNNVEVAVLVHAGNIACEEPDLPVAHFSERVDGFRRHIVITLHHLRTVNDDLADLALRQFRLAVVRLIFASTSDSMPWSGLVYAFERIAMCGRRRFGGRNLRILYRLSVFELFLGLAQ